VDEFERLGGELVDLFVKEGFIVYGAKRLTGYKSPPRIHNDGFGHGESIQPDVIGLDKAHSRIVFGLVRPDKKSLDSEDSLTQYNVLLDHKASHAEHASLLYVVLPSSLVQEFNSVITHYIHREYWHRIMIVQAREI